MSLMMNRKTVVPRVQWESNGLVQRNQMIKPDDIFDKCSTREFPEGASVRITSQKNGPATVYFNSPLKTRTYGSGKNAQSYSYFDATLKVSLPVISTWNKETYTFSYTGQLPSQFTLDEMNAVLKYVREQVQEMTGNTHIVIKDDRQKLFPELAN